MLRDPFVGLIIPTDAPVQGGGWPSDRLAFVVADTADGRALNTALNLLRRRYPHMVHVGVYEAGVEAGSLRDCVDRLERDPSLAFSQTGSVTVWRDEALEEAGDFPVLDLALTAA